MSWILYTVYLGHLPWHRIREFDLLLLEMVEFQGENECLIKMQVMVAPLQCIYLQLAFRNFWSNTPEVVGLTLFNLLSMMSYWFYLLHQ